MSGDKENKRNATPISVPGEAVDQAAADVIKAVAGDTAKGITRFTGNVFAGLFGDQISEWKTRNLLTQCRKTAEFMTAQGIDLEAARALPNGEIYTLFTGMAEADEESVQDMWAALLTNRLRPDTSDELDPDIPFTLRRMTGFDARLLSGIMAADAVARQISREATRQVDCSVPENQEEAIVGAAPLLHKQAVEVLMGVEGLSSTDTEKRQWPEGLRKLERIGLITEESKLQLDHWLDWHNQKHFFSEVDRFLEPALRVLTSISAMGPKGAPLIYVCGQLNVSLTSFGAIFYEACGASPLQS